MNRWKTAAPVMAVLCVAGGCSLFTGAGEAAGGAEVLPPPQWVIVDVPAELRPFLGKDGLPDPYPQREELIGVGTQSIDFWQANHFVTYRPETAQFLYGNYTPTRVHYQPGTLPLYERIVEQHLAGFRCDRDKALVLLREVLPRLVRHPTVAPLGPACPTGRGATDEELVRSGKGWCNEQARVFVRLCQVAGIPARMIFLFYSNRINGHVVNEFYADGRWSMADPSWFCVFPDAEGNLMSAAECHGEGKALAGQAYYQRVQQLLALSDEEMAGGHFAHISSTSRRARKTAAQAAELRRHLAAQTPETLADELWVFGVLNYPLPPAGNMASSR